ncbi:MAG: DEAD/DEAH box helicase [Nitrospiria bacterium]
MSFLDLLTIPQIQALTAPDVFDRGVQYSRSRAVLELAPTDSGTLWARVRGNAPRPYAVTVSPAGPDGLLWECSCVFAQQYDEPCKHVVAVLLTWMEHRTRLALTRPPRPAPPVVKPAWGPAWARGLASRLPVANPIAPLIDPSTWSDLRVDLLERPEAAPQVELRFRTPGSADEGRLVLPGHRSPAALEFLRGRGTWSARARDAKVYRTPLIPELEAAYDAEGRLVLTPSFRHPSRTGRAPTGRVIPVDRGWIWSDGAFYTTQPIPPHFAPYFQRTTPTVIEGQAIRRFLEEEAPRLLNYPRYKASPAVQNSHVLTVPTLKAVTVESKDRDWLWLDPVYRAGGHDFTFEELVHAAETHEPLRRGNDWVTVPPAFAAAFHEAGGRVEQGRVAMPRMGYLRHRAQWTSEMTITRDETVARFEADLDRLRPPAPAPEPSDLKGSLRPYQRTGYDWLWFLHCNGFHGILADEMGLGKTHQTMALLLAALREDPDRPSLIVCPTSVLDHWEDKIAEHAPLLAPVRYHGFTRAALSTGTVPPVVLTTYTLLAREAAVFQAVEWNYLVLDEAQKIKNPTTRTAKGAKSISARHRLALTGTPIENRLAELWSIMDFLLPGYLGSLQLFRRTFETPIIKSGDRKREAELKRAIHPFKLRRLKAEVLQDLPAKVEDLRHCRLSPEQAVAYRALVDQDGRRLADDLRRGGGPIPYIHIFSLLSKLKRLCDHPALVIKGPKGRAMSSGKFDLFTELMDEALDGGEKVVVFTQYLEMIDLITKWLDQYGVAWVSLRGDTRDRRAVVKAFQTDPECRVFVGSLLAGGVGIDLTAGSVVIHYDRWWNAARENQATDRVHRIGQTRGVQVIKLVTRGTLEEKIDQMIRKKAELMNAMVEDDDTTLKAFSREELIDILTTLPTDADS